MSKFGFDKIARKYSAGEKRILVALIEDGRKEFKFNFQNEMNSENMSSWSAVQRPVPPKILIRTGKLSGEAIRSGRVVYRAGRATLTVDPIDERGRPYADYHQSGIGRNPERQFITQSDGLTRTQVNTILKELDRIFL